MTAHDVLACLGAGTLLYHGVAILAELGSRLRARTSMHGNLFPAAASDVSGNSRPPRAGISVLLFVVAAYAVGALVFVAAASADPAPAIEVHFSPSGGCTAAITRLIASAHTSARLAAYQFTSEPIAQALIAAHLQHRDVQLVVDRSSGKNRQVAELRAAGVTVFVDSKHHIFHDKFVVVDSEVTETGSFNFTESAEKSNAENCVTIRDAATAKLFAANWLGHSGHSEHSDGGGR